MATPLPSLADRLLPPPFTYTSPSPILIAVGAEARLYRTHFLLPTRPCALKYRPPKTWRHPVLDARLSRHRILAEARVLQKCRRAGVRVPGVLSIDWEGAAAAPDIVGTEAQGAEVCRPPEALHRRSGSWMMMEWIEGRTVRQALNEWSQNQGRAPENGETRDEEELRSLMTRVGYAVGVLHAAGVVHGDLTTSNLMLRPSPPPTINGSGHSELAGTGRRSTLEGEIVLIDFGLAAQATQDEDRAVDLYVLERAFGSTHPTIEEQFQNILQAYGASYGSGKTALKRLEDVRMRGRKKNMIG